MTDEESGEVEIGSAAIWWPKWELPNKAALITRTSHLRDKTEKLFCEPIVFRSLTMSALTLQNS